MKQSFKTSKLYYGFPIFILGYQDQNFGHILRPVALLIAWEIG